VDKIITKTISFDEKREAVSPGLLRQLADFSAAEYKNHLKPAKGLFDPARAGEMAAFFNTQDKLIGFIRIFREPFSVKKKEYTLSTAAIHLMAGYSLEQKAARFFFMQSMKYKLSHPQEDFMHIALIDKPKDYQFITGLCTQVYPKAKSNIPAQVLELAQHLKNKKKWLSASHHPMVIPLALTDTRQGNQDRACDPADMYQTLNPGYQQGDSLLTCVPLSITNLCYGIKQLVSMPAL